MKFDVIVIGGGAAGLMCAIEAGKRGRSVVVLDHAERLGKKILISGGGRCNFTNVNATPQNYLSNNPNFCKSAFARYRPADFIALVEKHGIAYHEKKLGQLFCDFSSRQIVEMLDAECKKAGVQIRLNCRVEQVAKDAEFQLATNQGSFSSDALVIATGGLSFPKIGATDFGYRIAKQFGINLVPARPGLVPLTFQGDEQSVFGQLSGISIDAIAIAEDVSFRENILFTHRGLSGPAILQVSSYQQEKGGIAINLFPEVNVKELLLRSRQSAKELKNLLAEHLPQRFTQEWCTRFAPSKPMHRYSNVELEAIAQRLQHWEILPSGTEGYAKAEVTLGGVDTGELSSKTMEARKLPGLYFIGEIVDVTGWLGGYNFQWAWASGFAAGQFV
ncbi:NAD(P)/FAD-dependent oxidoreductase [Pedosphaera parvula]|uniref:HI0933 family protein n=1 Tax=Pedosphaera parvula (strain Ellin514) TaxID=320771 RepID=B9XMX6_PEDPL|nr:NAD(P)/FAD-dependent oxidoreductase [Pedosphaera parvula]EEF58772.1 HI0933 family protein [Pedosphaera parvula Ellin514]